MPKIAQGAILLNSGLIACSGGFFCADEEVFGRVFGVDKFHDFSAIAQYAEELGAAGVGEDICGAAFENAVCQDWREDRRAELGAQFALAAGRRENDCTLPLHGAGNGVVGCGVAGVQAKHNVGPRLRCEIRNAGLAKRDACPAEGVGQGATFGHERWGAVNANETRRNILDVVQIVIRRKREIRVAATAVDEHKWAIRFWNDGV